MGQLDESPQNMKYPVLAEFLNKEFAKRYMKHNGRYSQARFSAEAGVTQPTMSNLMRGNTFPSRASMDSIANNISLKVYDVCGVPRRMPSDPLLVKIVESWPDLTPDERHALHDDVKEIMERNKERMAKLKKEYASE